MGDNKMIKWTHNIVVMGAVKGVSRKTPGASKIPFLVLLMGTISAENRISLLSLVQPDAFRKNFERRPRTPGLQPSLEKRVIGSDRAGGGVICGL